MNWPSSCSQLEWELNWRKHFQARYLKFTFKFGAFNLVVKGDNMQFTMLATQTVPVMGTPVDVNGNDSKAVLSSQAYTSSDSSVFTIAPDPNVPGGAILTGVAAGTATLLETSTATEPDGTTTEQIQGVATIILTTVILPPPPAAAIKFTFGNPTP